MKTYVFISKIEIDAETLQEADSELLKRKDEMFGYTTLDAVLDEHDNELMLSDEIGEAYSD